MDPSDAVWAGLIILGGVFEAYALANGRDDDTLSEKTRKVFRARTSRVGRAVFLVAWLGFSAWFTGHIMDWWA